MNRLILILTVLISFTTWARADLEEQCAIDLCGSPGEKPSAWVNESNVNEYVRPGVLERFPEVERAINRKVTEQVRSNEVLIALLKRRTANLEEFYGFRSWAERDYMRFAKKFYFQHFHILTDPTKTGSEKFILQIQVPERASEVFAKGLRSYADSKLASMKANSPKGESCDGDCRAGLKEKILSVDIARAIKNFEESNDFNKTLESVSKICKGNLVMAALKPSDVEAFSREFPSIKEQFIQNVAAKYTEESKTAIRNFFDELRLVFDSASGPGAADSFISRMNNPTGEFELPDYNGLKNIDILLQLVGGTSEKPYDTGSHICRPTPAFLIWDSFNPLKQNQVSISLFSTYHVGEGRGLISHELGHALSFMFQEKMLSSKDEAEFTRMRKCATQTYKTPILGPSNLSRLTDHRRTEEDNADTISYIANPDKSANFGCSLLQIDENMKYVKPSLVNPMTSDVHSSALLRALREGIHKGKRIPQSCKDLMEANKESLNFEKCF